MEVISHLSIPPTLHPKKLLHQWRSREEEVPGSASSHLRQFALAINRHHRCVPWLVAAGEPLLDLSKFALRATDLTRVQQSMGGLETWGGTKCSPTVGHSQPGFLW